MRRLAPRIKNGKYRLNDCSAVFLKPMRRSDLILFIGAVSVAIAAALVMFTAYYSKPDLLWADFYHDRNAHFAMGVNLALALKTADPFWFVSEIEKVQVWGPLQRLILAAVLAIGGIDHRLAIVPSLIGWILTMAFTWLITRRLFEDQVLGTFAAAVALTLLGVSPAFRLLGSDVMLESLGAGLSGFALWAYFGVREDQSNPRRWRVLAIALTLLFFHKGNYWGLVATSLLVAYASEHLGQWGGLCFAIFRTINVRVLARSAIRDPLLIVLVLIIAALTFLFVRGGLTVFGRNVSYNSPINLTELAYDVLFVRLLVAWHKHRDAIRLALGVPGRELLAWHLMPVAVSFLVPKRLTAFLWFVGPANGGRSFDAVDGIRTYYVAFTEGFHAAPSIAFLVLGLAVIAIGHLRQLPAGARAIVALALLSFVAVVIHPQHQGRFLASWLFAVWILAGAGAANIFGLLVPTRSVRWRICIAAAAVIVFACGNLLRKPSSKALEVAIRPTSGVSDIELVRPYLTELLGVTVVGVATTFGMSSLFQWVLLEDCKCHRIVKGSWITGASSRDEVRRMMLEDLAEVARRTDRNYFCAGSRYKFSALGWTYEKMIGIVDAMHEQNLFVQVATFALPVDGAQATIWARRLSSH